MTSLLQSSRIALSLGVFASIGFWIGDAVIDKVWHEPDEPFLDLLIYIEGMEFSMRFLYSAFILVVAIIASVLLRKLEVAQSLLQENQQALHALNIKLTTQNELLETEIQRRKASEIELERLATTDQLTGVFNRRKFDEILAYEIERNRRYHQGLAFLILDIDHFKRINDQFGHAVGDKVLIEIAHLLRQGIRKSDHVFRLGGEEFAIIAQATAAPNVEDLAEHVRHLVASHAFDTVGTVTISLGATMVAASDVLDSVYQRADHALYQAKNQGRNRYILA